MKFKHKTARVKLNSKFIFNIQHSTFNTSTIKIESNSKPKPKMIELSTLLFESICAHKDSFKQKNLTVSELIKFILIN